MRITRPRDYRILRLVNHQRRFTTGQLLPNSLTWYKCGGCTRSYRYRKTLNRHIRLECGQLGQFHCPYCPYRGKQKVHLVNHLTSKHRHVPQTSASSSVIASNCRSFTGQVMFPCALCGRQYKYKDSLRRHLRLECGKDPQFQCSVCDYRAKQKSTLVSHMATKHSKVSFPADIVARQTWKILSDSYSKHVKLICKFRSISYTRTGMCVCHCHTVQAIVSNMFLISAIGQLLAAHSSWLQLHKCPTCSRTYKYKENLYRHLRQECGKEPMFPCAHCPYRAKQKSTLTNHVRKIHTRREELAHQYT
ncbi:zinc finger Y-chromosomal protein-like [Homalodisca vitripennis]|uniref:zinc finger Y-chromosomal protein-like n=1 Tax=Homalodisca vitripennis TaxID=197043 RepID=UPI001EEAAD56|nr:zinc finger Y-chromosomal protein-like [Homalodisca vitripennis]